MEVDRWRADRLDTRLHQGRLGARHLRAVARELALFHGDEAAVSAIAAVLPGDLAARVADLRGRLVREGHDAARVAAAAAPLERLLAVEAAALEARVASGAFGRAHGALGLDTAYVDSHVPKGQAQVPEGQALGSGCESRVTLEQPAVAVAADAAWDVARLAIALRCAARADLAESFIAGYAEATGDFGLYRVLACYEGIHALERAAAATDRVDGEQWLALATPRKLGRRAQLVAVGGRAASGKSTVAARLAAEFAAPLVSADRLHVSAGDDWSLFLALGERAVPVLDTGRSVVLDASFASQATRRGAARLARERGLPFVFTECRAYEDARLRRLAQHAGASDASAQQDWDPVRDLEGGIHVVIDTTRPEPRGLARVRRILPASTILVA